jgi:sugar lactone lactonase YvrE/ketosteroid isomerase-like protein
VAQNWQNFWIAFRESLGFFEFLPPGKGAKRMIEHLSELFLDLDFYAAINPDLAQAGLTDSEHLLEHLKTSGLAEGRRFSPFVDLDFYAAANPDLAKAGLTAPEQLLEHLQTIGLKQGRRFSPFADLNFYRNSNTDLVDAGVTEPEQLLKHLQTSGLKQGRRFSPAVDLNFYVANNPDAVADFANDREKVFDHLVSVGVAEGRKFVRNLDLKNYLALNPDVAAEVGGSLEKALNHLLISGLKERRQGAPAHLAAESVQIQIAQQLYEAIAAWIPNPSNTQPILQLLSPDVIWNISGDANRLPFAGRFLGAAGVQQCLTATRQTLFQKQFAPLEFIQDGERVAVRIAQVGTAIATGQDFQMDIADLLAVRSDGLISSLNRLSNTYTLNQALAGATSAPIPEDDSLTGKPAVADSSADTEASRQVAVGMWNALINGSDPESFNPANPKSFFALCATDAVWSFAVGSDPDLLPYSGAAKGTVNPDGTFGTVLTELILPLQDLVQAGRLTIEESFAAGNRVVVHLKELDATVKKTGNRYDLDLISWIVVGGGKVQSVQTIVDTNLTVRALRPGGTYPLPPLPRRSPPYFVTTSLATNQILTFDQQGNFTGILGEANQTDSGLVNPSGITFGPDGNLYVNSRGSNQILRYDGISGKFLGVFGQATNLDSGLLFPTGIKFGPDGHLYAVSGRSSQILKYDGSTGQFLGVFAQRDNGYPGNIIVDDGTVPADRPDLTVLQFGPDGDLYVGSLLQDADSNPDTGVGAILRYAGPLSTNPGEFKGVFGEANNLAPTSLVFGPDKNLYVNDEGGQVLAFAGPNSDSPGKFKGVVADVKKDFAATGAKFAEFIVLGMEFGPEGHLYTGSAAFAVQMGGNVLPAFCQINIYALENSDSPGKYLGVFGEANTKDSGLFIPTTPIFSQNAFLQPFFLVGTNTDPQGILGSDETDALAAYDRTGNFIGFFSLFPGNDNPLNGIGGVVLGANGNILVSSQNSNQVLEYDGLTGKFIGVFGDASHEGSGLEFPAGIAVGPDNNIYVSSLGTERILKFDGLTGSSQGVFARWNTSDSQKERFTDLAFGPDGNLYVCLNPTLGDTALGKAQVRVYSGATGELLRSIGGLDFAASLDFGPDGLLYVSDDPSSVFDASFTPVAPRKSGRLVVFNLQGNQVRSFYVGVGNAGNIAFSPDGNLYLSNPAAGMLTVYNTVTGQPFGLIPVPAVTGEMGRPTGVTFLAVSLQEPVL